VRKLCKNDAATPNAQTTSVRPQLSNRQVLPAMRHAPNQTLPVGCGEGLKLTNSERPCRRSLFAIGPVDARHQLNSNRIFFGYKTRSSPATPAEISNAIKTIFEIVCLPANTSSVWIADVRKGDAPVLLRGSSHLHRCRATLVQADARIDQCLKEATSMRQLNWLWQWAALWQPPSTEGVASSLLDPSCYEWKDR